ncbi:hypothetical protein BASA81_008076 [Batrachochytrium salamandrivorans]|nr:hypothetical protein BASA81_008076 [Batrachochytrium salamandrivorans]
MDLVEACFAGNGTMDWRGLEAAAAASKAAPLTRASLPMLEPGSLVSFRGMVQDMFDPELFCAEYCSEVDGGRLHTGMFRDAVPVDWKETSNRKLSERQVLYLVPVPGEAGWVRDLFAGGGDHPHPFQPDNRMEEDQHRPLKSNSLNGSKRVKQDSDLGGAAVVLDDENLPYPDADLLPCIIKLYNREEGTPCKLHDVITVTGVLSLEYSICEHAEEYETRDCLPSHVAPRIHVISLVCNGDGEDAIPLSPVVATAAAARQMCLKFLCDALQGDALAAEFLLLWAISTTSSSSEVVGRLTLGLTRLSPVAAQSDVSRNRLVAGRLQVAPGTRFVLDETQVNEGQRVTEQGMQNIQALQRLAKSQQVEYDFTGFQRQQHVDVPLLVLASNNKSLAVPELDVVVAVCPTITTTVGFALPPPSSSLTTCQHYLELARRRAKQVDLPEPVAKRVENDYVMNRQQPALGITDQDLHVWLNLAKLTAASLGRDQVTLDDYARAKTLDDEGRKRRTTTRQ